MIKAPSTYQASVVIAAFSRKSTVASFITRVFTGASRWSHCGIVDTSRDVVIEALMFKGVVETPLDEWKSRRHTFEFVEIACPDPHAAIRFARVQLGESYDYLGALGAPFRAPWGRNGRWYCSELLESALAVAGRRRWRLDRRGVSPAESYMVL
jgi:hypothetical protein